MQEEFSTPRALRLYATAVAYIRLGRGVQTSRPWRREFMRREMEIEAWEKQNIMVGKWDSPPNPRGGIRAE